MSCQREGITRATHYRQHDIVSMTTLKQQSTTIFLDHVGLLYSGLCLLADIGISRQAGTTKAQERHSHFEHGVMLN